MQLTLAHIMPKIYGTAQAKESMVKAPLSPGAAKKSMHLLSSRAFKAI